MQYDVLIVGGGPGGIYSAYELLEKRPDLKIALFEAGHALARRHCPIDGVKVKSCVKCPTCAIMNGFGGAGAFSDGKYNVLCNSMLLTEGWDCPEVDCVVVLRSTKVRALYCQMVGRGTRLAEGKDHLLLLDFLWNTEKHELCRPACLICEDEEVQQKMTQQLEQQPGVPVDIEEAENKASEDVVADRESKLAEQLESMKKRKSKLVDPLQYEMSIQSQDLTGYVPSFGWESSPPTDKQKKDLEKRGIDPDAVESAGKAEQILRTVAQRQISGLATPKQIRCLEKYGFQHVGSWSFDAAKNLINRIAANGWRVPRSITAAEYVPEVHG